MPKPTALRSPSLSPLWVLLSPMGGSFRDVDGKGEYPQEWELLPFETEAGMRSEARELAEVLRQTGAERWLQFSFSAIGPTLWNKIKPPCGQIVKTGKVRP